MVCDFMFFSTVVQAFQHDGVVIIKGCVKCTPVYGKKKDSPPPPSKNRTLTASLLGRQPWNSLSYWVASEGGALCDVDIVVVEVCCICEIVCMSLICFHFACFNPF